jgi:site-specific DNA-cytosine methylase
VSAYYNEHDQFNVEWLKHLMAAGVIAPGEIDGRDIQQVRAEELRGFTQCHFFAGIGVWSYALRSAGWPDSERAWTGSCPCQPFSVSGKQEGSGDERHLWPEFNRLIRECRPAIVFGEQVASGSGRPEEVRRLWHRETLVRLLQESALDWRGLPDEMQRMLQGEVCSVEGPSGIKDEDFCDLCGLPPQQPSQDTFDFGETPSLAKGVALLVGSVRRGATVCDRCGSVSSDGLTPESRWRQDLGQSIARSNRLNQGLSAGERADSALLLERDGECMGSEQNSRDCERDQCDEAETIGEFFDEDSGEDSLTNGLAWLDLVSSDLEGQGYTIGAVDTPACGFGAPHRRQRLYWVADVIGSGRQQFETRGTVCTEAVGAEKSNEKPCDRRNTHLAANSNGRQSSNRDLQRGREHGLLAEGSGVEQLADAGRAKRGRRAKPENGCGLLLHTSDSSGMGDASLSSAARFFQVGRAIQGEEGRVRDGITGPSGVGGMGDAGISRLAQREHDGAMPGKDLRAFERKGAEPGSEALTGFWSSAEWLYCRDEKYRPVEPGTFPLAHGIANRVGKLRGYGNALCSPQAEAFIRAYLEVIGQ